MSVEKTEWCMAQKAIIWSTFNVAWLTWFGSCQRNKVTLHKSLRWRISSLLSRKWLTEPQWSVPTALCLLLQHTRTLFFICPCQKCRGTTQRNQVNADKQACLPPGWQISSHTRTHARTFFYHSRRGFWSCDKLSSQLSPSKESFFCSVVWCRFSN